MRTLSWLPEVLRSAGIDVYVMPGAETRSSRESGLASIRGIVWHHTATGTNWADGHVAALLRDGRRDLAGPLAQVGIERDGTWVIVALGRANHNGYGVWGNESLGLEFYNKGDGTDPWPKAQVDSGIRGITAILRHLDYDPDRVQGHKETDPGRKIDPANLDMAAMRRHIDAALNAPPVTTIKEDDMDWTSLMTAAFRAKVGTGPACDLNAENWGKVWFWGDVLISKTIRNDDPWGGYQWIKANEPALK